MTFCTDRIYTKYNKEQMPLAFYYVTKVSVRDAFPFVGFFTQKKLV